VSVGIKADQSWLLLLCVNLMQIVYNNLLYVDWYYLTNILKLCSDWLVNISLLWGEKTVFKCKHWCKLFSMECS